MTAKTSSTTTTIQVRLPDGTTVRNSFEATTKILAVYEWLIQEYLEDDSKPFLLQNSYPRHLYDTEEKNNQTLKEAGLTPQASLIVIYPNAEQAHKVKDLQTKQVNKEKKNSKLF